MNSYEIWYNDLEIAAGGLCFIVIKARSLEKAKKEFRKKMKKRKYVFMDKIIQL